MDSFRSAHLWLKMLRGPCARDLESGSNGAGRTPEESLPGESWMETERECPDIRREQSLHAAKVAGQRSTRTDVLPDLDGLKKEIQSVATKPCHLVVDCQ